MMTICQWCHCETGTKRDHGADWRCRDALLGKVARLRETLREARQLYHVAGDMGYWENAKATADYREAKSTAERILGHIDAALATPGKGEEVQP